VCPDCGYPRGMGRISTGRWRRGERIDVLGRLLFRWRLLAPGGEAAGLWPFERPETAPGDEQVGGGEVGRMPARLDPAATRPTPEGEVVKLAFERVWPSEVERLWVRVVETADADGWLVGRVDCEPYRLRRPRFGDVVVFTERHVVERQPGA